MYYQTLVKNLFNDMYHFMNGTQAISFEDLTDNYQDEPLFLAFLGNLDQARTIAYNDAMKECYAFYKKYCGKELTEEEWETVVAEIQVYDKNWDNIWCRGLVLALLDLLDQENKEWKAERENQQGKAGQEPGGDGGFKQDEMEDSGQQALETAA